MATTSAEAGSLAQWWLRFGDPQLANLVPEALQANASVKTAQTVLRWAMALRNMSAAGLQPTLGSSGSRRSTAWPASVWCSAACRPGVRRGWIRAWAAGRPPWISPL